MHSLGEFLSHLNNIGDLAEIQHPAFVDCEITEIHRRVLSQGGPALLFKSPVLRDKSFSISLLTNLFGSRSRILAGLNCNNDDEFKKLGDLLSFLNRPKPPEGFRDAVEMTPILKRILSMRPSLLRYAPCQEIILEGPDVNLYEFPIQKCWPEEPDPLITWPLVVTKKNQEEDKYNIGIYRMQVIAKNKTLMRWLQHRGGAQHYRNWKIKHGTKPMPVAVVIGIDPATILAAVMPIPDDMSEYQFSGLLRNERLTLVECKTIPIKVPANAEIILEGYIIPEEQDEGPYGDHTGYYNSVEKFPVFEISAITMKKDPIYLSTYTGRPPDEPSILGETLNELFVPIIKTQFPEIVDFYLPPEGCSYRFAVISIKKSYPGHAKRVMMGAWSYLRQFIYTKFIVIVDDDIDVKNWNDVIWAISTRSDPVRDTVLIENTPIDYLDFASPDSGLGGKMGIDATNKMYPETKREWGKKMEMSQDIIDKVTQNWEKYGIK